MLLLRARLTKRRFAHCLCIFLLLFAQWSALGHAAWHAYTHPSAPPEEHHEDEDDASFQRELCGLDSAFTQVLGGVQVAAVHHWLSQADAETIAHRSLACVVLELQVPLSRGPPVLS